MMEMILSSYKQWHIGHSLPELGRPVYVLIDEDTFGMSEPYLVEATCRWLDDHNPPFIWDVVNEDGTVDSGLLAGGFSVYAWRYRD